MYVYENHLGGIFFVDEILSQDECWCETCGDSDCLIGFHDDENEDKDGLRKLLMLYYDEDNVEYVDNLIENL